MKNPLRRMTPGRVAWIANWTEPNLRYGVRNNDREDVSPAFWIVLASIIAILVLYF